MSASPYHSYASPYMVMDALGADIDDAQSEEWLANNQDRLFAALLAGSRYVDAKIGTTIDATDDDPPYTPVLKPCPEAWTLATVDAAVRFFRSAEATFGVIGFNATGSSVYARSSLPEVDLILFGHRTSFGIG